MTTRDYINEIQELCEKHGLDIEISIEHRNRKGGQWTVTVNEYGHHNIHVCDYPGWDESLDHVLGGCLDRLKGELDANYPLEDN